MTQKEKEMNDKNEQDCYCFDKRDYFITVLSHLIIVIGVGFLAFNGGRAYEYAQGYAVRAIDVDHIIQENCK